MYSNIIDPLNGNNISIYSKRATDIIKNYLKFLTGGAVRSTGLPCRSDSVTDQEIQIKCKKKNTYKKTMLKLHPDRNQGCIKRAQRKSIRCNNIRDHEKARIQIREQAEKKEKKNKSRRERLNSRISVFSDQRDTFQEKLQEYQRQIQEAQRQLQESQIQFKEAQREYKNTQSQLEEIRRKGKEAQIYVHEAEKTFENAKEIIMKSTIQIQYSKIKELQQLGSEILKMKEKLQHESVHGSNNQQIQQLNDQFQQLKKEYDEVQQAQIQFTIKLKVLEKSGHEAKNIKQEAEIQVQKAQTQVRDIESYLNNLIKRGRIAQAREEQAQAQIKKAEKDYFAAKRMVENLDIELVESSNSDDYETSDLPQSLPALSEEQFKTLINQKYNTVASSPENAVKFLKERIETLHFFAMRNYSNKDIINELKELAEKVNIANYRIIANRLINLELVFYVKDHRKYSKIIEDAYFTPL